MPHGPSSSLLLQRVVSFFVLALVAATWKLWIPQASFPQIPLIESATTIPFWCDWLLLLVCATALLLILIGRTPTHWSSAAWLLTSASLFGLMVLNQHRLQPWAYLALLSGLVLGTCGTLQAEHWLRSLVISVYIFSAISKFDYLFVTTLGQEFVETGFGLIGITVESWPETLRQCLALSLPIGELFVAFVLVIPRFRRVGVILGIALHVLLLMILGPLGMNHRAGVLIWNLQFCALLILLFWPIGARPEKTEDERSPERPPLGVIPSLMARTIVAAALFLPLLDALNKWDHWLSWGLYSTRAPRVELYLSEDFVSALPAKLQQYCSEATYSGYLRKFALDRWSLAELGVPIYPQDRFHAGLCVAIIETYDLEAVVAVHSGAPSRRTGERKQQRWTGSQEVRESVDDFWLNALPRDGFDGPPPEVDDP